MTQQYETYQHEYGRAYVYPNERMYVHSSVRLPSSEIDFDTGMVKPSSPRRGRTQAMRLEYELLDKEHRKLNDSFNWTPQKPGRHMPRQAAFALVGITVLLFLGILLAKNGMLAERRNELKSTDAAVQVYEEANALLRAEIEEISDASKICYIAARELNMIPAESAEAIHLMAMDTRPMEGRPQYAVSANASVGEGY